MSSWSEVLQIQLKVLPQVRKLAQEQQLHGLLKGEPEVALLDP